MSWTDERVELLRQLWGEGLSASQIAGRLGGCTRNAVISKIHRLGLSGRSYTNTSKQQRAQATSIRRAASRIRARNVNMNKPVKAVVEVLPPIKLDPINDVARVDLQDLSDFHCRWPVGDPRTKEFGFCGKKRHKVLPYCDHHVGRAYIHATTPRSAATVEASNENGPPHTETNRKGDFVEA